MNACMKNISMLTACQLLTTIYQLCCCNTGRSIGTRLWQVARLSLISMFVQQLLSSLFTLHCVLLKMKLCSSVWYYTMHDIVCSQQHKVLFFHVYPWVQAFPGVDRIQSLLCECSLSWNKYHDHFDNWMHCDSKHWNQWVPIGRTLHGLGIFVFSQEVYLLWLWLPWDPKTCNSYDMYI